MTHDGKQTLPWFQFSLSILSAVVVVAVLVAAGLPRALQTYRDWRRKQIIDQLYSVEVEHVPIDDEPPILSLPDKVDWDRKKARWEAAIRPEK